MVQNKTITQDLHEIQFLPHLAPLKHRGHLYARTLHHATPSWRNQQFPLILDSTRLVQPFGGSF